MKWDKETKAKSAIGLEFQGEPVGEGTQIINNVGDWAGHIITFTPSTVEVIVRPLMSDEEITETISWEEFDRNYRIANWYE